MALAPLQPLHLGRQTSALRKVGALQAFGSSAWILSWNTPLLIQHQSAAQSAAHSMNSLLATPFETIKLNGLHCLKLFELMVQPILWGGTHSYSNVAFTIHGVQKRSDKGHNIQNDVKRALTADPGAPSRRAAMAQHRV
eukprot:6202686-Pleurochrysis_carterae.AAC.4